MKHNVLVFPCGSEVGLEIHRSLEFSTHFNIIGGSSVDDHGKYVYKNYIDSLPFIDDGNFTHKLNQVIEELDIDFIIPAHDSVVLKLAQEESEGKLSCNVITSPVKTCEIARSKLSTYSALKDTVPTPTVYDATSLVDSDFPIFLKPDVGQGAKGTYIAYNQKDVDFYFKQDPSLLAVQYLPGKEYTIDCFSSQKGELIYAQGRERARISNGISVNSSKVIDPRFQELANTINSKLDFKGAWFFQVKESSKDELVLMEIAPRVAGAMGLSRALGVNLVIMSLFDAIGYPVRALENQYNITIDRALENRYKHDITYHDVYLDFDDTVVFEGKLNTLVMTFVFQCINNGIKIHLLTKHKENLEHTLRKYRLQHTFDEIIWIRDDTQKYTKIIEARSIFIDDSFAERAEVQEKCNIAVFDSHMIEALLEKT